MNKIHTSKLESKKTYVKRIAIKVIYDVFIYMLQLLRSGGGQPVLVSYFSIDIDTVVEEVWEDQRAFE